MIKYFYVGSVFLVLVALGPTQRALAEPSLDLANDQSKSKPSFLANSKSNSRVNINLGRQLYGRCMGCHSFEYHRTGPKHCGILGRKAGTVEGFRFSKAMQAADIVWTQETLDTFLKNPRKMVKGNSMPYAGVKSDADRRNLVAFIAAESQSTDVCGGY